MVPGILPVQQPWKIRFLKRKGKVKKGAYVKCHIGNFVLQRGHCPRDIYRVTVILNKYSLSYGYFFIGIFYRYFLGVILVSKNNLSAKVGKVRIIGNAIDAV